MAKRRGYQKDISFLEKIVIAGYYRGVWHSMIYHTILLLILALLYDQPIPKPKIVLDLSFAETIAEEVDQEPISEIPQSNDLAEQTNTSPADTIAPEPDVESLKVESYTEPVSATPQIEPIIQVSDLMALLKKTNNSDDFKQDTQLSVSESSSKNVIDEIIDSISRGQQQESSVLNGVGSQMANGIDLRLKTYGAKTGDVQISISWNTIDDIDLHVMFTPGNGLVDNINWTNKIGRLSGGMLDIDMNANYDFVTNTPVENVFWPPRSSPNGFFVVGVHFYRSWSGIQKVPVIVRVKHEDKIETFNVVAILYAGTQEVTRFSYPSKKQQAF